MIGYLTFIMGLLAVAGSVWASVWLARRRGAIAESSNAGEGLRHAAQMLGLEEVRESRLFQARILAAWGEINDFGVECELWEQVHDPFYRVTIAFPKPLSRGIRISRDAQGGLLHQMMDAEETSTAEKKEESASEEIVVQSKQDLDELRMFLQDDLRKPLERLAARVNRLQMGDEYLHVYVKSAPDGVFCENLLRDALAVANKVFGRAIELGPSKKKATKSSYGQARSGMSRRVMADEEGEERVEEAKPTGRVTLASMAAISSDTVAIESVLDVGADGRESSVWARRSSVEEMEQDGVEREMSEDVGVKVEATRVSSATLPGVAVQGVEAEESVAMLGTLPGVSAEGLGGGVGSKRASSKTLPGVGELEEK